MKFIKSKRGWWDGLLSPEPYHDFFTGKTESY